MIVWRSLTSTLGIDINTVMKTALSVSHIQNDDDRQEQVEHIANVTDRFLRSTRYPINFRQKTNFARVILTVSCCTGRRFGTFLPMLYVFIKVLYLLNTACQLVFINRIFGVTYGFYGYNFIRNLYVGNDYDASWLFPRVTYCDVPIRRLGNVQGYTLQCTVNMNVYYERMFTALFFWFTALACVNLCSLGVWIRRCWLENRGHFVEHYLALNGQLRTEEDRANLRDFVGKYLRADGHFMLRMLAENCNDFLTADIVQKLWEKYKAKKV